MFIAPAFLGFSEDEWYDDFKVVFDGVNRLIIVQPGVTSLEVKEDLYSAWKRWAVRKENAKYAPAMEAVGGRPLPQEGKFQGVSYFLINGWRMRTWEGDHSLNLNGVIYTAEGDPLFVPTIYPWNIQLSTTTSGEVFQVAPSTATLNAFSGVLSSETVQLLLSDPRLLTVAKFLGLK